MDISRTIIIGNSGSGKSWLAARLAAKLGCPHIDLDAIHWLAEGYNQARDRSAAIALTRSAAAQDKWIIEGIYGWLACEALSNATSLIWLRLSEQECIANIQSRGRRGNASTQSFSDLQDWAATYRTRTGSSSYIAHQGFFDDFSGAKLSLQDRREIAEFAAFQ